MSSGDDEQTSRQPDGRNDHGIQSRSDDAPALLGQRFQAITAGWLQADRPARAGLESRHERRDAPGPVPHAHVAAVQSVVTPERFRFVRWASHDISSHVISQDMLDFIHADMTGASGP